MKNKETDPVSARRDSDQELLSLAFDCSEMVAQLARGYELEKQGEHESAISAFDSVEARLEAWLEKLDGLDADGIDKERIFQDLDEAREAIKLDF